MTRAPRTPFLHFSIIITIPIVGQAKALTSIEHYFKRLRDALLPPNGVAEQIAYMTREGKYHYLSEKAEEDIRREFAKKMSGVANRRGKFKRQCGSSSKTPDTSSVNFPVRRS